uniref:Uncharacterized protein n=1 Tax=Ananas comosus var. bracteatus TaxID=296719 RepID=A0A6V7NRB0_ANACO|nr:unnamed protein product [Ananas comosus var. bracteatus]
MSSEAFSARSASASLVPEALLGTQRTKKQSKGNNHLGEMGSSSMDIRRRENRSEAAKNGSFFPFSASIELTLSPKGDAFERRKKKTKKRLALRAPPREKGCNGEEDALRGLFSRALSRKGSNRMERRGGEEQETDDASKRLIVKVVPLQLELLKLPSMPNKAILARNLRPLALFSLILGKEESEI